MLLGHIEHSEVSFRPYPPGHVSFEHSERKTKTVNNRTMKTITKLSKMK